MRNRAKCKICADIIESLHETDLQFCQCGLIFVDGGDKLKCGAKNWDHFARIDDAGREVEIKVVDDNPKKRPEIKEVDPLSKEQKLDMLLNMIKNIEDLPATALYQPVTQYDLYSSLSLVYSLLKD